MPAQCNATLNFSALSTACISTCIRPLKLPFACRASMLHVNRWSDRCFKITFSTPCGMNALHQVILPSHKAASRGYIRIFYLDKISNSRGDLLCATRPQNHPVEGWRCAFLEQVGDFSQRFTVVLSRLNS